MVNIRTPFVTLPINSTGHSQCAINLLIFISTNLLLSFLQPLAASDYLQIAQYFHTVIIKDVPQLDLNSKSQARRFITLIDTLYDNKVRVVISADNVLTKLFSAEKKGDGISDEHRMLMDDLKIAPGSEHAAANVFTGDEEVFAFQRTVSRLAEMQSSEYWQQWDKKSH